VCKSYRLANDGGRSEKDTARGGDEDIEDGREGEGEEEENVNSEKTRIQLDGETGCDDG
jgi:hypothetical protein